MTQASESSLPLFYRQPEMLTATHHADLRLREAGYDFARDCNAIPLAIIEFGAAMRHYPIVFAAGDGFPLAVLGLDRRNAFVADGEWTADHYIPAYARRYPFVFVDRAQDSFVLAIDRAASHFQVDGAGEGQALFADGKPTGAIENVLAFCRDFHGAHIQTEAFVAALLDRDMLVDQHADARLASGQALTLRGFRVVDRPKFEALPDDVIVEWHRKGWLALLHFHFLSLDRFADLLDREQAVRSVADPAKEPEDA